jgi:hypothetical protein
VTLGANISVSASFVWRCLTSSAMAPFPHPAHRTGHADFPHPALGQDIMPSPTAGCRFARSDARARSARRGAGVDRSRPASPDLVLGPQPPAQPYCGVAVECPVRLAPRTVSILFGWKISFKDRLEHQHRCCHAEPNSPRAGSWSASPPLKIRARLVPRAAQIAAVAGSCSATRARSSSVLAAEWPAPTTRVVRPA